MFPKHCLALVLLLALAPLPVNAQASPVDRANELLRRAQQAYFRMRMDDAQRHLIEAVAICERDGCPASDRAVLYLALGAVAYTASGDGLRARMAFDRALDLDPDVMIDRNLSTPEVRQLFDEVRAMHQGGGEQPPPPPASGPSDSAPRQEAGRRCTSDASCGPGLVCESGVCEREEGDDEAVAEPPREAARRRRIFFMELGYSATAASAHDDMQVTRRPDTSFFGEDFQLDGRVDNDSYVLSGTFGCEAPMSEYCVRVTDGLFAFAHGFHATLGAYVTDHFGLAARMRLAPVAGGDGFFERFVLGARFYYRPIAPLPTGFHFAVFAGPMFGQIQVHPKQETTVQGADIARPWGETGLYGAEIGFPLGHRFTPGFGLFVSPEAYVLAPNLSFGLQVTSGIDFTLGWARR